jgi:hypothetical protein
MGIRYRKTTLSPYLTNWDIGIKASSSASTLRPYTGSLNDARIYSGILSDKEIKDLFNEGLKNWSKNIGKGNSFPSHKTGMSGGISG